MPEADLCVLLIDAVTLWTTVSGNTWGRCSQRQTVIPIFFPPYSL